MGATAATARTWLLVEQPGPWGRKALTGSRLDPAVGRALDRAADGTGVRVALIRRPGRHADLHTPASHRVYLAHTAPGDAWVRTDTLADPAELTALDFTALGAGSHGGFGTAHAGPPLALVCTNGRRDRCCAVNGRPLAAELAASGGADAWEVTHLGGHRFSPTMLVLPYGYTYGRVDGQAGQGRTGGGTYRPDRPRRLPRPVRLGPPGPGRRPGRPRPGRRGPGGRADGTAYGRRAGRRQLVGAGRPHRRPRLGGGGDAERRAAAAPGELRRPARQPGHPDGDRAHRGQWTFLTNSVV